MKAPKAAKLQQNKRIFSGDAGFGELHVRQNDTFYAKININFRHEISFFFFNIRQNKINDKTLIQMKNTKIKKNNKCITVLQEGI